MITAPDAFLSYKSEDRARLLPLVSALKAEGFTVWWDAEIDGGTNWREDIQEHLDTAKCVIVAWTKRSIGHEANFVRDEAARAQRRGVYLPISLDAVDPPLGFGEIQAFSLQGWKGNRSDPRYMAVAAAVRSRISGEGVYARPHPIVPRASRRTLLAAGGVGVLALAGAGGWMLFKPKAGNSRRIAVLPFANLSGDPNQTYFSEGIAEELRGSLSRIGLEVIGRSSSEAVKNLDTKTAASRLRVANIVTGSVRRSPEIIRINAQLVSGSDGVERWAQSYDRAPGDAIKIQSDIAANVAQALSITLGQVGRAALELGGTTDSVAQDLLLQSRKIIREADGAEAFRRSVALADAAIARDSRYANAYVEKANALWFLAQASFPTEASNELAEGEGAARKAVALAPKLGPAYAALAHFALDRLDFASALRHTKQSLALSQDDPDVLSFASRNLVCFVGPQGLRLVDRAIALDPLNGRLYRRRSELLTYLRSYPQAIEAGRKALELAPELHITHIFIGDSLLLLGHPDEAKAEYEAMPTGDPFRMIREMLVAVRTGDTAGAKRKIARMKQKFGATFLNYQHGEVYAQLENKDRAFAEFDNAINAKSTGLIYLKVDPFLDPIRDDPRYVALLEKLKFP